MHINDNYVSIFDIAYQEFHKKHEVFISHNEIMNEIKKLSLDQTVNSLSDDSFGGYAVKEEIAALSSKWSKIDAIFTDLNNQIETMINHQNQGTIYLEPSKDMEQRLQTLRSQQDGTASNMDNISTNLNITKLSELISSLKNFEKMQDDLKQQISYCEQTVKEVKIDIDQMQNDAMLIEDERHLSRLLTVKI